MLGGRRREREASHEESTLQRQRNGAIFVSSFVRATLANRRLFLDLKCGRSIYCTHVPRSNKRVSDPQHHLLSTITSVYRTIFLSIYASKLYCRILLKPFSGDKIPFHITPTVVHWQAFLEINQGLVQNELANQGNDISYLKSCQVKDRLL